MHDRPFNPEHHITNVAGWEREFESPDWRFFDLPIVKSYKDIYPGMCLWYSTTNEEVAYIQYGGHAVKFRSALAITYEAIICLRNSKLKNVLTNFYRIYYKIAEQVTAIYSVGRESLRREYFLPRLISANDHYLWMMTLHNCFYDRLVELKLNLQQEDPELIKMMELELKSIHDALSLSRSYLTHILEEELRLQEQEAQRRRVQRRVKPIRIEYGVDEQNGFNVPMTMKTTKVTNFQVVSLEYSGIGEDQELVATIRLPLKGVSLEHVYNRKRVSRSITQPSTQSSNGSRAQSRSLDI